ncbi:hypothetical protein [Muriicola marianensis]|uniref:DUF3601 domain-containing protein n=1 Tax=Muriicola marianensis TaxID=1324801 RepID=A0ABQ1R2E7_9FLAO|nr:hypothetical protein [Muriicola marianensis]GGD53638.1 hypothetical protein GCM10011361_20410 [Muriicola marianensis]
MRKSFLKFFEEKGDKILEKKGFKKILDNDDVLSKDSSSFTRYMIFSDSKRKLKISARDWRDEYYVYYLELDGIELIEVNITEGIENAADKMILKLHEI